MHPYWNPHPYYPIRNGSNQLDTYQVLQLLTSLENQIQSLVKIMEQNNELLKTIEQQNNRVITSGGGSVIVRM